MYLFSVKFTKKKGGGIILGTTVTSFFESLPFSALNDLVLNLRRVLETETNILSS